MDATPNELTVVFADLAGFTALTEAHGDVEAADAACKLYSMAERALVGETRAVKHIGDAVMFVGHDCGAAVETALRLADLVGRERMYPALRTGVHAGPTVERDGDYLGATVNLAARVAGRAHAGQTLCTAEVVASVPASAGIVFKSTGETVLKNVPRRITLFEARRINQLVVNDAIDPVCQMRVEPGQAASTIEVGGRLICFCSRLCALKFAAAPSQYTAGGENGQT